MVTRDQRYELIAKLRQLPDAVEAAVKGLSEGQLDTPYGEGKWKVRQVVHHLADSHMIAFVRTKHILAEEEPKLFAYEQDSWAATAEATSGSPITSSLSILRGLHARWAFLFDSLPETAWTRTGIHYQRGKMTLSDILELYAGHGERHVKQITDLRKTRGW